MTAIAENTSTESATIAAEVEMRVRSHPMAPASNLICHPGTMIPQIEQLNIDLADIKLDLTEAGSSARRHVKELKIAGQVVRYSDRFGNSLSGLIGQSSASSNRTRSSAAPLNAVIVRPAASRSPRSRTAPGRFSQPPVPRPWPCRSMIT